MTDRFLLSFADRVNEIYYQFCADSVEKKNISAPRLVLNGTQSSGKSSVTNRIIGYPLLPTGEHMVTRTPINVRLYFTETCVSHMILVLSVLENGEKKEFFRTTANTDDRTTKFDIFRKKIGECTDKVTKNQYSISNIPLFVEIYSNKVPNFSFVDLPGQVATVCEDKGQSDTLISEIESVIEEQLSIPNTIALTVIQSKTDLETDIGVALIKNMKKRHPEVFRTIGVITKPDLLDAFDRDRLNDIVGGKMAGGGGKLSKSVNMDEGFFVVNNKCESHQKESEYFMQNFDNHKDIVLEKRFGISNLVTYLHKYLAASIKRMIPEIKANLTEILRGQRMKAQYLGVELTDSHSKMSYLGKIIYQLNKSIVNSLESHGTIPNVGSKIGKLIDIFVVETSRLEPFSEENLKSEYIADIIESFNGYHLTAQVSLEQLIERCIVDRKIRPIMLIIPISSTCIRDIVCILEDTIDKVMRAENIDNLASYPKLKATIMATLIGNIKGYARDVENAIKTYLETEEEFFWSTSPDFRQTLKSLYLPKPSDDEKRKDQSTVSFGDSFRQMIRQDKLQSGVTTHYSYETVQVRTLATEYFKTITVRARDYIVKQIIVGIVKRLEKSITNDLNILLTSQNSSSITELFAEDPIVAKDRITVSNNINKIEEILSMATTYESS
jgi:hypothetical protein